MTERFTKEATKVLELALREALSLGHNYVSPEHLLLGLIRLNEGVAAQALNDCGATPDAVRNAIIRALNPLGGKRTKKVTLEQVMEQLIEIENRINELEAACGTR